MKINKELINKLKRGEIAIDNTGNPNVELLRAVLKEAFPDDSCSLTTLGSFAYYCKSSKTFWRGISGDNDTNLPTIPLNDFLEKEQFPKDDFGVIVENSNGKEIIDYLHNKGFIKTGWDGSGTLYNYGVRKDSKDIIYTSSNAFSKTYTLQQLKNLENNMENKEIEKYEILKDVWGRSGISWRPGQYLYVSNNESLIYFKETGLINNTNYFKPVYKSKEVVITVNNTVINIKGDRMVAEGKEFDIKWLRAIRELFNTRASSEVSWWNTEVESVKIGCKTGWNKKHLDEIITAYNELQKQK